MNIIIIKDNLKDGQVLTLLTAHHQEMQLYSPPESIHALNQAQFFDPALTFWSARDGKDLAACGALKQLSNTHGEVKAMRTSSRYVRLGLAEKILKIIIIEAKARNYTRLSLETGVHDAFMPALRLYEKHGFISCGAFGDYKPDPHSLFMSLRF